jgi:Ca2+/Na+ antiporter
MILNIVRLFLIFLLIIIFNLNIKIPIFFKFYNNQLALAIIVIFIIVIVDHISGFILGIILLVIYYKFYINNIKQKEKEKEKEKFINKEETKPKVIKKPYISEELLKSAQDNIFSEENYKTEIIGFESDKKVYGIQGLDIQKNDYMGYDCKDIYSNFL